MRKLLLTSVNVGLLKVALIEGLNIFGSSNEDVHQIVVMLKTSPEKWTWLTSRITPLCTVGKVLIFASQIKNVDELSKNLRARDVDLLVLHGDMFQHERNDVIHKFRTGSTLVLVATDVASRGLDIPSIKTVINYDVARDIDTHVHRIGRTGRAGEKGTAYTLVTEKDKDFAGHLVRNLESASQHLPLGLLELANKSTWFRKQRSKLEGPGSGRGKKLNIGGRGLGYKERPGRKDSRDSLGVAGATSGFSATPTGIREALINIKPGGNRLTAMKAAFANSYKSNFHEASADTSLEARQAAFTAPTPEWKAAIDDVREKHRQNQDVIVEPLRTRRDADGAPWIVPEEMLPFKNPSLTGEGPLPVPCPDPKGGRSSSASTSSNSIDGFKAPFMTTRVPSPSRDSGRHRDSSSAPDRNRDRDRDRGDRYSRFSHEYDRSSSDHRDRGRERSVRDRNGKDNGEQDGDRERRRRDRSPLDVYDGDATGRDRVRRSTPPVEGRTRESPSSKLRRSRSRSPHARSRSPDRASSGRHEEEDEDDCRRMEKRSTSGDANEIKDEDEGTPRDASEDRKRRRKSRWD